VPTLTANNFSPATNKTRQNKADKALQQST
jgi:hypothetical protein